MVVEDRTEPTAKIVGVSPDRDWYRTDFTVFAEFEDPVPGSGLASCQYKAGAGFWRSVTCPAPGKRASISVSVGAWQIIRECDTEGEKACKVEVRAIDGAGNESTPPPNFKLFNIDWTRPRIGPHFLP
ncbi:MAG: hypothetical protein DDT33_01756 [Firmicutes bacterium]|nr:hypothetical protein [Bacillota bacterium]